MEKVVAGFLGDTSAVLADLESAGVDRSKVSVDTREAEMLTATAEMREESNRAFAATGSAVVTEEQAKGSGAGLLVGGAIGLLLGLVVGFVFFDGWLILIPVVTFAMAGGTAGGLFGGSEKAARAEGSAEDIRTHRTSISVASADPAELDKAADVFGRHNADRVDRFNDANVPLTD